MEEYFKRTELLLGKNGMEKLYHSKVAVFGIGGVGSFATEALARSGIGHLTLIDGDVVNETNINRQLIATTETIGKYKTDVMKKEYNKSMLMQ
ncbi:tRNA threonylcarbamoyladenosine dehydratase [Clostridium sp. MD294]|nr:tRNA threonylcarbamoyladenosine dehydratase [Clostridium sp. MD294]